MSTMQRLTLIGLSNYDSTLFDNLELPDGYDKETFINSLLLEHGEKCVLYSNPAFMKNAIGLWGRKWSLELTRIYEALTAEYDPIYNYDRYEEYADEESRELNTSSSAGHTAKDTPNYNTVRDTNTSATTERTVSADNSSGYQPDWKETVNGGKNTETTSGTTQDLTESSSQTGKDTETKDFKHTAHLYGNIGVTTSAQMVTEVVKQRFEYNLYAIAARLFANELLIGIY